MSVHSQQAASHQAAHPEFPKHVVTAVLVSHDGERWLPDVLTGLLGQDRPVQDVIAADTGSADSSATLLTEAFGPDRVLHLARRTGFGTAVAEAARTAPVLTPDDLPYLKRPSAWDPVTRTWDTSTYDLPELPFGEPVHWLWLLHDDAAPEPAALAELLRQADASPSAVIVGAKQRGWYDRRQLLEVGVSIASSGRRWTGLDRREQDQGQHDQVRPVLSVSTAGMLIRRDIFERLGGFDRRLPLMRDDVDLCWRAQTAGHRVLVAPTAVLRHAEASSRERRSIDCAGRLGGSPHRIDKAAAAYTLLVNARTRVLPWILIRLVLGTLLRVLAYLVGKLPGRALDETAGLLGTLLRPGLVIAARRRRKRIADPGTDPKELRPLFPPPLATVRATIEQAAGGLARRSEPATASRGRHGGAVESGPTDEDTDSLDIEQFARVRRLARRPGPMLVLALLLASLLACRDLISGGVLTGGALLPAPGDAGALWDRYLGTWQPVGTGGTESAPPYLAFLALLGSALLGGTGPAMTLLLVACVPLAGASAYFSSRPLLMSRLLRAWASIAYAFLPAVTGALAGGRIGTAVLAVLLPPLARTAVTAAGLTTAEGRGSWRAVWACALLLTAGTAFTPVIWPMAVALAVCAVALPLASEPGVRQAKAARLGALLVTPLVLLGPWSWSVLLSPSDFLHEVGLRFETAQASPFQLLNINPGGPGTPGTWLLGGLLLAALGALLRQERRLAIITAWAAALVALVFAVWSDGDGWAGPATLVYGIALLSAAVLGADGARYRVAAQSFGWRQPVAVAVAGAAAAGPLLVAAGWILGGAAGPLERGDPEQVPAFVAEESSTQDQARTLVLAGEGESTEGPADRVTYTLVRGSGARLGDADLARLIGEDSSLSEAVGDLVAGSGADQTAVLAGYAVRYVLVQDGSPHELHRVLDTTPGLQRLSQEDGSALWRVDREVARVMIRPAEEGAGAEPVSVPAGAVEVHTDVPEGPAGRTLRLADAASAGWQASLNGEPLSPVTVDGWAQGFELPAGGGRLDVVYETSAGHTGWVWFQGLSLLVLGVLALPGRRRELDDDLPEEPPAGPAPQGRRARREAAAAAVAAAPAPPDEPPGAHPPPYAPDQRPEAGPEPVPQGQEPYPGYPGPYQDPGTYYPDGQPIPQQQPYGGWDDQGYDQSYVAPYDYPADYGDGSNQS
ncbi:glycosyltransferase [Streptomyces sp. NBC_01803]|uniref:glycosyltransferase n=1 Tax=Streptomyces sp. NBC_01803 TaxID=2975946 RepID=UPI002DDBFD22|nr:glycosyltransferase [Streptomyces sp. NBC_01803]WSA44470.1 glycosyltransferase family 2 protein [Streptomyces sp. NBC_01803]